MQSDQTKSSVTKPNPLKKSIKNQKGQTLIEYLVIVAILGVGSIVVMGKVGEQINKKFTQVAGAMGATVKGAAGNATIKKTDVDRKTFKNFAAGAGSNGQISNNKPGSGGQNPDSGEPDEE